MDSALVQASLEPHWLTPTLLGMPVGVAVLDRELRYLFINDSLAVINGLPRATHIGKTVRELMPALAPVVEPMFHRALAGESFSEQVSGTTHRQPGVTQHWSAHYFPLHAEGAISGIGVAVTEISEQVKVERALARSHAGLLTQNTLLRTLSGAIAHDVRTPIATAMLKLQTLASTTGSSHTAEIDDVVDVLRSSSEMVTRLLRLVAVQQVERADIVSLPSVIGEAWSSLESVAVEAGPAKLDVEHLPPIMGDELLLRDLFQNLFENAIKHRHPERSSRIRVASSPSVYEDEVVVVVEDNGPGLPDSLKRSARRLGRKSRASGGSGLGLAIANRIVSLHGGTMTIEDNEPEGARFHMVFPAVCEDSIGEPIKPKRGSPRSG